MQTSIRVMLLCALISTSLAIHASSIFSLPINQIVDHQYALAIQIPSQYRTVSPDEKGAIPGILTFLGTGFENDIQHFVYDGHDMRKLPQIIRLQQIKNSPLNVNQFIHAIKTKMKKDLLVPPEIVEEYMLVTKEYTMHSLGLILGYSGQANVEVIYLQYYSGKHHLSGIQVERTLPPQASGQPASLDSAKKELKALKNFVNNVSFVRKSNTHLTPFIETKQ